MMIAKIPSNSVLSFTFLSLVEFPKFLVKITEAVFKKESADDIVTAIIPEIAMPLNPIGNRFFIITGTTDLEFILGYKTKAEKAIAINTKRSTILNNAYV